METWTVVVDAVSVVGAAVVAMLVFVAVWCWIAAHNVKVLDRELEVASLVGQLAILRSTSLAWYKEELYKEPSDDSSTNSLFLAMQAVWPAETIRITAEWAAETDPGFEEGQINGKE